MVPLPHQWTAQHGTQRPAAGGRAVSPPLPAFRCFQTTRGRVSRGMAVGHGSPAWATIASLLAAASLSALADRHWDAFDASAADVVVVGATPAGCAAAVAAARTLSRSHSASSRAPSSQSQSPPRVVLVEPSERVGGMTAGGLGNTDLGQGGRELGGITREFYERVAAYYGPGGPAGARCTLVEPHVAQAVYEDMLREAGVSVLLGYRLDSVRKSTGNITAVTVVPENGGGGATSLEAKVFVDATYEGDLLAAAGVPRTVGRESRDEHGEPSAGRLAPNNVLSRYQFQVPVDAVNHATNTLLPLVSPAPDTPVGGADNRVEAYCYRLCMSKLAGGRAVRVPLPTRYDPAQWELFRRLLAAMPDGGANATASDFLYFAGPLGNSTGLASKNDVGENGAISLDYVGASWSFPNATPAQRKPVVDSHVEYTLGFLHFLSTDPAVPTGLRADVSQWGLCADEFASETPPHFPRSALYVREARRMLGMTVVTEHDRVTNRTKPDSVGLGSYNCDCHMVERFVSSPIVLEGDRGSAENGNATWVLNEGWLPKEFDRTFWELPLSMMLPHEADAANLVVPVAVSATHVAFNGVRLEPTWSILGHAAGVVAALATTMGTSVQGVAAAAVQSALKQQGQILHAADVPAKAPPEWCGR